MSNYQFNYDSEDDVLYIKNSMKEVEESVEVSEDIVLDLDKKGMVVGIEIFYASEFFGAFNKEVDKSFLSNLEEVQIAQKEMRNNWFLVIMLKSDKKVIYQPMPPLRKSEYVSPLATA